MTPYCTPLFRTLLGFVLCFLTLSQVAQAQTTINYAQNSYCQQEADPTPTITGMMGGSFSAPAGLSINSATGTIDLSASTVGNYTITYTFSNGTTTALLRVLTTDDASFTYNSTLFCTNDPNPIPTITGQTGGTFVSAPFGLTLNSTTGEVDVTTSIPGNYTIRYNTSALC